MTLLVSATLSLEASPGLVLAWSWSWPGPVGGPVSYRRRSGWMLAEAPDSSPEPSNRPAVCRAQGG